MTGRRRRGFRGRFRRIRSGPNRGILVKVQARPRRMRILRNPNFRTAGLLGIETKFSDDFRGSAIVTNNWTLFDPAKNSLSGVAQGDSPIERDGRMYTITSLHLKGELFFIPQASIAAVVSDVVVRVLVILDTQTNGAQITGGDVMVTDQPSDHFAFRNLENTKRTRVLWDKTFVLPANNVNEGAEFKFSCGGATRKFVVNQRFKNGLKVRTGGTSNGIGQIKDNSLHIMAVASVNGFCTLTYEKRMRFRG